MAVSKTYDLEIEGLGAFVFRKRTLRDQFRIEAEVVRVLGGPIDDEALRAGAIAYATLLVLTEQAPDGWDLDDFDPLDDDSTARIFQAHRRLREHEIAFRTGSSRQG